MLCYTESTNGMEDYSDPRAVEFGVNYTAGADFAADVQKLRDAGADVVIAMMHWGREYRRSANSAQARLGRGTPRRGRGRHPRQPPARGAARGHAQDDAGRRHHTRYIPCI